MTNRINEQASLVHELGEIEALVEVCRNHKELQTSIEGVSLSGALMITVNKLSKLHEEQAAKLEKMECISGGVVSGKGGER